MLNFNLLFKVQFKQFLALPTDKKSRTKRIASMAAIGLLFAGIIAVVSFTMYGMAAQAASLGVFEYLLSTIMFGAQMMVLMYGGTVFMSVIFFSKDNEFLQGLPCRTHEIYLSKLLIVYLNTLGLTAFFMLPSFIAMGIGAAEVINLGAAYYILAVLACFTTPLLALLIISILALPILYISKFFRRSSAASFIGMIAIFVAFMALYLVGVFKLTEYMTQDGSSMENLMLMMQEAFRVMGSIMYPNLFIARSMVNIDAAANAFIYLAIIIGAAAISIILSILTYRKILTGNIQTSVTYSNKRKVRTVKAAGQMKALIMADIKSIFRNTTMAYTSLMGLVMAPLMVAIFGFTGIGGSNIGSSVMMEMMLLTGANYLAILSVSRDGEKFFIYKFLPIAPKTYLNSKLMLSHLYVLTGDIICTVLFICLKSPWTDVLMSFIMILALGTGINYFAVLRDIQAPNLSWVNIKQLTNNRLNTIIPMIACLILGLGFTLLYSFMTVQEAFNATYGKIITYSVVSLLGLMLAAVCATILYKRADEYYYRIEASNG